MGMAAAVAGALASRGSRAQGVPTRRVRRIGTLTLPAADPALAAGARSRLARFLDARGRVEGANLVIERQFADFRPERLPSLARQLLDNGAAVLLALRRQRQAIADTCLRQRLPCATAALAPIETTGFLMRFGPTVEEFQALRPRAFEMVDRMLRGADPAVTPVELPRQFEFVLNLKTAAAINLSIPRSLRLRADRLVE